MDEISKIFNINIDNKELFRQALTHPSFTKELNLPYQDCYERLEFLGDAVLKLVVSEVLYNMYPDYTEGSMSKIRSIVVSDATLAKICEDIGLAKYIIVSPHEEKQGCKNVESVKACAFEATLGAFYLDGKLKPLIYFIKTVFEPYIIDVDKNFEKFNAKALLQEYTQGLSKEIPCYRLINETGPAHKRTFSVEVLYKNEVVACGEGKTKKEAEQHAAYEACIKLGVIKNV